MVLLLLGVLAALRWVLPRVFGWAAASPEMLFIWSLCWCFVVLLGAHTLHLSHETGAFMAGVALAQLPYSHDLRRRVHPLMNFFVAVFFVTLGINMHPGTGGFGWAGIAAICVFVLLAKPLIVAVITRILQFPVKSAFSTGISLGQVSEFSFILLAMGAQSGLLESRILSAVGLVGLITIAVSSCGILYDEKLYALWQRFFPRAEEERTVTKKPVHGHVIVVGMNTLGRELVKRLAGRNEETLAIDNDPAKLRDLPGRTLLGSVEYLSVLEEAELHHAKLLISALHIEDANDLLAFRCRQFGVPCSIIAVDLSVVDHLLEMDVAYLMIPKIDGIKSQNARLEEIGILSKPDRTSHAK
jgi:FlaA1/EpsC-like NDP-sugar epimerase